MHAPSKRMMLLIILMASTMVVAGCASPSPDTTPTSPQGATPTPAPGIALRRITGLEEIDTALASGPVVLELGESWCDWCQKEKPVMRSLAGLYTNVAFGDINVDQSRVMMDYFYVSSVPQLEVIVRKNPDGSYLYIDASGVTTTDRYKSRIIGYREEDALKPLVDAALAVPANG